MANGELKELKQGGTSMVHEQAYLRILAANASIQHHLAVILEAKAKEMGKAGGWTCLHVSSSAYPNHELQIQEAVKIHEQLIEVIEGITKIEAGLARHLKLLVSTDDSSGNASLGDADLSSLFDQ